MELIKRIWYDRNILDCNFRIGYLVRLKNETGPKFDNKYKGSYQIKKLNLRNNVTIVDKITNKEQIVHKNIRIDLSYIINNWALKKKNYIYVCMYVYIYK